MHVWHLTTDTPRAPARVVPGEPVLLRVGTWPIEPGQSVWISRRVERDRVVVAEEVNATWQENSERNSYWQADIGPFEKGDRVTYAIRARAPDGQVLSGPTSSFRVGPALYLAILWHQHQPIYKDTTHAPKGSYRQPWVRLHALRDYYSMAALVAEHLDVHLTINLTPSLLWQIEDYIDHGATDGALDLTLTPAERLTTDERDAILSGFFDADWHHQIFPHARYKELFIRRREGEAFSAQDVRDVQMWFNLAWFGKEFRDGPVTLATGETVSVHRLVERGAAFSVDDVEAMVAEQYKILRAVIPIHRDLQARGQIEVSTTPLYHPILPLLVNTDAATIDRPGATYPNAFRHQDDADAHVRLAMESYERRFGRRSLGMWPAEGAVSQFVVPIFARHQVRWIATDGGVLARSGRWGYDVANPDVLCQPYRAEEGSHTITIFFRDTRLSDEIGFHYYRIPDPHHAARDFLLQMKERFARRVTGADDRVLTIALDGENAWGAYPDDARPFLHALYRLLERDREIETVTFSQYLDGGDDRSIQAHPIDRLPRVHDLFTGSWIDENGSAPGVDLGTWIGEDEENRAWNLLGHTRDAMTRVGATPDTTPAAFDALYMAEGSDWFWWFGDDQDSGRDQDFDDLFRMHLRNVYRGLDRAVPAELDEHIVPHAWLWTFTQPIDHVQPSDRLTIQTNCPGDLSWRLDDSPWQYTTMAAAGGVMAGVRRHHVTLGPFSPPVRELRFRFRCRCPGCDGRDACWVADERVVHIRTSD
jgi:alpha-amylase/alpha-mannosidase (GH57 family)